MKNLLIKRYKSLKQAFVSINWDRSWKEEEIILNKLKENRNSKTDSYIYDSIFQYKSQVYGVGFFKIFLLHVISAFSILYMLYKAIIKSNDRSFKTYDGGFYYAIDNVPYELKTEKSLVKLDYNSFYINKSDFVYLLKLVLKLRFNFILFSAALFRVLLASYAKKRYCIKFLLCDMEYSAASGILRDYCHKNDMELYNYMHGEKVLTLRDCFCSFDRFYVWSDEYKIMFKKLYANSAFYIYNPWKEVELSKNEVEKGSLNKVCYILKGIESKEEIEKLKRIFEWLTEKKYNIYVKDHPRQAKVSHNFENIDIVDSNIPFLNIINDFDFFISQYSTVLTQCYFMNVSFFIDDISNEEIVFKLKERGYVLSDSKFLLSNFLKKKMSND